MRRRFALLHHPEDFFVRVHVDRIVIGRAAELALLGRRGIPERHAQTAADTEIHANRTHHPAVTVRFFDDAPGNGTGGLTDRARERPEAAIGIDHSDRLRGLLAGPRHHLGPHTRNYIG